MALPLIVEHLPILDNIAASQVFSALQHKPWAMLLDTCNNQLSDGRYDIIVIDPIATVSAKNGAVSVNDHGNFTLSSKHAHYTCPFEALKELQTAFKAQLNMHSDIEQLSLPYLCGALGYAAYDLNVQLNRIKDEAPGQYIAPDFAMGIYAQSLIFDNYTQKAYHCHVDGMQTSYAAQIPSWLNPPPALAGFSLREKWHSNVDENQYAKNLASIADYLRAGDCYQINYAQRFKAAYCGSEWLAYQALRKVNKAPFSAFIRLADSCILSLSPERFLQTKQGMVETKPIKGTMPRSSDPVQDKHNSDTLLASEKDKAENLMIVDLLRNDLSKHCLPHSVKVPSLFALESYPAVHHMVSTVLGKLKQSSTPIDLLKGAFPGGSITGAPKVRAMQIIQELEPDKRSIYCGSIGYVGVRDDMDTNICIRTVLAEQGHLYCWAGGGIVLDSDATAEYQESFDKVAKILPILQGIAAPLVAQP